MGWQHSIAGGQGKMVVRVFQSPNYTPGASGWAVFIDGSAEFNNLVIRGEFFGTNFIIDNAGAFFYSGVPANGNLIASIASAPGVDGFGNAYTSGHASYLFSHYLALQAFQLVSSLGITLQAVTPGPDGTNPAWQLDEFTATLGLIAELVGDGINVIVDDPLVALLPGAAVGPHSPEIWHTPGLGNGWAASSTFKFRLMPDNTVFIQGNLDPAAKTSNLVFTLPGAYQPATTLDYPIGEHGTAPLATAGAFVRVASNGQFQVINSTTTMGVIVVSIFVPLDY